MSYNFTKEDTERNIEQILREIGSIEQKIVKLQAEKKLLTSDLEQWLLIQRNERFETLKEQPKQ